MEVCERYIGSLKQTQQALGNNSGPPDTNSIVAVVRDDLFLRQMEKYADMRTNRVVVEPLVADLHVAYGRDSERGMAYLTESDRARLGLALPELRKLALSESASHPANTATGRHQLVLHDPCGREL